MTSGYQLVYIQKIESAFLQHVDIISLVHRDPIISANVFAVWSFFPIDVTLWSLSFSSYNIRKESLSTASCDSPVILYRKIPSILNLQT